MLQAPYISGPLLARKNLTFFWSGFLFLAAFLLLTIPAAAKPFEVEKSKTSFVSAGKDIRVECFVPKDKKGCPTIVLLHDSAGLVLPGPIFRHCSEVLAKEGYVVMLVHYFDSTGMTSLKAEEARKAEQHWPTWKNAVRDAVKFATKHPQVDSNRIGLLGFSLGAYLSLAVATEKELKIAAVAEFFGGLPELLWKEPHGLSFPPTLIIHGLKDAIVPPKEAFALQGLFTSRKIPFEIKLYDCGHLFLGTQLQWKKSGPPGSFFDIDGDIADARDLTLRFFAKHLMKVKIEKK